MHTTILLIMRYWTLTHDKNNNNNNYDININIVEDTCTCINMIGLLSPPTHSLQQIKVFVTIIRY